MSLHYLDFQLVMFSPNAHELQRQTGVSTIVFWM